MIIIHINLWLTSIILLFFLIGFLLINMDYALRRKWEMIKKQTNEHLILTNQPLPEVVD